MKIEIYSISECDYCAKAKVIFDCLRLDYQDIHVRNKDKKHVMDELQELYHFKERTFPKVFVDDKLIGGFTEVKEAMLRGDFGKA